MRRLLHILFCTLLAAVGGGGAAAWAAWPKPAAGESASGQPEVIFTFDDGPDHRYTPRILAILRQHDIQAIFFWVGHRIDQARGRAAERRAAATRAVLEGHLVGTHTVNHVHLCAIPPAEGAVEIDDSVSAYERLTGLPMILFRAPYGDHCDRVKTLLAERNLAHVHWDIDPLEWKDHDSSRVAGDIIHKLRYLDGRAMVLMHDTKLVTVRALEQVLAWLDAENRQRAARGQPTIRIIPASDWVAERLDPALVGFARSMGMGTLTDLRSAANRLVPQVVAPMLGATVP